MNYGDGQLLDDLRVALATPPARPDPIELAAFDRIVAEWRQRPAPVADEPKGRFRAIEKVHRPRVVAAGVVITTLGLGTGVAAAAGAPVTRGIREVAHEIGLPVESPAVVDAKDAMSRLRDALARSDDAQLRAARDQLRSELGDLGASDRASLERRVDDLLQQADARLIRDSSGPAPAPTADPTAAGPQHSARSPGGTPTGDTSSGPGEHGSIGAGDGAPHHDDTEPSSSTDTNGSRDGHSRDFQGDGAGSGAGIGPPPTTVTGHHEPSVDDSHGRGRDSRDATTTTTAGE